MFERSSFVALTARNLDEAKAFWVKLLGFHVTEERANDYFIVDADELRLCVDREDGEVHRLGGADPTIGLKVDSATATIAELITRGLSEQPNVVTSARGLYAVIHNPEGRSVVLTEHD
jgi:catechol 2,3-dioxygenase-like lactoylglutathione lyase family enzyme